MSFSVTVGAAPDSGPSPLAVNFSASPSGGAAPYAFLWTLGDGQTSALQNLIHVYAMAGDYAATCRVTDSVGEVITSDAIPVSVSPTVPNATYSILPGQVCAAGEPATIVPISYPPTLETLPAGPLESLQVAQVYDRCLGEYTSTLGVSVTLTLVEAP